MKAAMTLEFIIILLLVGVLIGFSKGGLGGPLPVALIVPLLSLVMPTSQAVGLPLPLLIFADIFALRAYWRKWDMHYIRLMLPAGLVGIAMGVLALTVLKDQDRTLRIIIGIFTLIAGSYKLASDSLKSVEYQSRTWHGVFAGWLSAFVSSLANSGAAPWTAYMLLQRVPPIAFIGTTTLFFAIVNALKLPGYLSAGIIDVPLLLSIWWVLPVIVVAVFFARWAVPRINRTAFERMMLVLLFLAGFYLILSSL